jgi:glycosyltransferase A (GT-A) superfamily protein (DUF2064 family)
VITVVVMAKECVPGRVKTRLTPPYTPEQAAAIAAASLRDTLAVFDAVPCERVLSIDGHPGFETPGWSIRPQPGGGLDARIADAMDGCRGPTLVVGMDTPHLTASLLAGPLERWDADVDAWFGPATDGGYWVLGLREPDGDMVRGIPMSRADTGDLQRARLREAGLRTRELAALTDIDDADSLAAVAGRLGDGHLRRLLDGWGGLVTGS